MPDLDIEGHDHQDAPMSESRARGRGSSSSEPPGQVVRADRESERRRPVPASREPRPPRFQVAPNRSALAPGVESTRLNQLADELEVEDFVAESEP